MIQVEKAELLVPPDRMTANLYRGLYCGLLEQIMKRFALLFMALFLSTFRVRWRESALRLSGRNGWL